jgi:hypothetical protein
MKVYSPNAFFKVIMPVGSDSQVEEKQKRIREIAGQHGIVPQFPRHEEFFDIHAALRNLRNAEFVLVDLTFERPSCYYELGLAEAIDAKIYLIAAQGTDIHQTSKRDSIRFYENLQQYASVVNNIFLQDRNI